MKTNLARTLGITGLVLVMAAVVGFSLARHYRASYLDEKSAREAFLEQAAGERREIVAAASGYFLLAAQEGLLRASVAVGRDNFEQAREEVLEARRMVEALERMPFSGELEGLSGLRPAFTGLEVELSRRRPESRKTLLEIVGLIEQARDALFR